MKDVIQRDVLGVRKLGTFWNSSVVNLTEIGRSRSFKSGVGEGLKLLALIKILKWVKVPQPWGLWTRQVFGLAKPMSWIEVLDSLATRISMGGWSAEVVLGKPRTELSASATAVRTV